MAQSAFKYLKYGVPLGSILGPLLFLIFINDLSECLEHTSARLFADDTNIIRHWAKQSEAEDLEHVRQWLLANGLCLNMVKTEYLLTGSKYNTRTLAEEPCLFIGHKPVKRVLVTKLLL